MTLLRPLKTRKLLALSFHPALWLDKVGLRIGECLLSGSPAALSDIRCPSMWGERDRIPELSFGPDAENSIVPGNHNLPFTRLEEVSTLVLDFF
ncbi:MAG: hypothetical protein JXA13_04755 [Anaerolineales bacterium]|nr:hypothetical protein [Anaerolineales bacterium]